MVNICGKCEYFMRTEMDQQGNYYHYCGKADELFPPMPDENIEDGAPDTQDGEPKTRDPTILKLKFNDPICQYFKKKRR